MFDTLKNIKSNKIYSFGKVISKKDKLYKVQYEDTTLNLLSTMDVNIDDWVLFYGIVKNETIISEYVEIINGIDCNVLKGLVEYLKG